MQDFNYTQLDPGIVDTVRLLHQHGYVTTDSGDGYSKPADERAFDVPHVVLTALNGRHGLVFAEEAASVLDDSWQIEASYSVRNGVALVICSQDAKERKCPGRLALPPRAIWRLPDSFSASAGRAAAGWLHAF